LTAYGGASATDTCSGVTWTNNYSGSLSDLCGLTGAATVTFTATDACGNFSSSTGKFTIQDTTAPSLSTFASDLTVECDGSGNLSDLNAWLTANGGASASDTCSSVTWSNNYSGSLSDLCGLTGSATVTFTATDACGNFSSSTGSFTIQDTTAPSLSTFASDLTVECDGSGNLSDLNAWLTANGGASASDTCSSITWTNNYSGSLSDLCGLTGSATVTFTATDACGNFSSSTGTFTIQDTTAPSLSTFASDLTVECDGSGNLSDLNAWLTANGGASASDTCSGVTWTNNYSGSLSDLCGMTGFATVTFTATDACGNFSSSTGTFTIQDTTAPQFTSELPQNISVSCDAIPTPQELTGIDSCSNEITITTNDEIVQNESACIGQFTILRTWIISDSCGNNQSYTQTISVSDTTPPTLITPLSTDIDVICSEIPPKPNLEFEDNCSGVNPNIVFTETTTTISIYAYIIIRNWIVSDNCGNEASFSQTINVSVNEPFDAIPYRICKNETIDLFTLLDNNLPTNGTWEEVNTSGSLSGSTFNPSNLAFGYYTIRYIVSVENNPCPLIYEIYINVASCDVLAACDITIYNAVSPNGDGLNEIFMIDGITCYPNNTVEIYNRWGVNVYKANGYNNGNVSFNGMSQNKLTVSDNKLPGDTYFYILKYSDVQNNSFEKTGYLYIKY
jgi:gliding motility-associated-like protein